MESIIKLLPEHLANKIAAGEVVQRPASVVKELLENAIDAGARAIELIIRDAGKTLIQVVDDGKGMSFMDARMSLERHATSKIIDQEDLYRIRTLGFRGEALASIGSVAQVELKTCPQGEEMGAKVLMEDGRLITHEQEACPPGTSIAVKNLFFNVPARRNFLKSDAAEFKLITDEFIRVALSYPEVRFSFHNGGDVVYQLAGMGLKSRIQAIFGKRMETDLLPVKEETSLVTIHGYIGHPSAAKKTRGEQFFFANRRYIRSPYLQNAVMGSYEGLLSSDFYPSYFLFLEIEPQRIDINVHPTKSEIRFEDEKAIYQFLRVAIRRALNTFQAVTALDFDKDEDLPVGDVLAGQPRSAHFEQIDWKQDFPFSRPQQQFETRTSQASGKMKLGEWEALYESLKQSAETPTLPAQQEQDYTPENPLERTVVEVQGKYLAAQVKGGLMLVHIQFAHERILFERFKAAAENGERASQNILFPEAVEIPLPDKETFTALVPYLNEAGFDLSPLGRSTWQISAIPAGLTDTNIAGLLDELLAEYKEAGDMPGGADIMERTIICLARRAAQKTGMGLSLPQRRQLLDDLFNCAEPGRSTRGKPTFHIMDMGELDRKFRI